MVESIRTAHAKINLTLRVLGRRADGFHALESLIAFAADVGDGVRLFADAEPDPRRLGGGQIPDVTVIGPHAGAIVGDNLLARTLALVVDAAGAVGAAALRPVRVHLDKQLPVAAGLGGGSADAAALLGLLQRHLGGVAPQVAQRIAWTEIAARLGSDVPVCVSGVPAIVSGRGEIVTPLAHLAALDVVLANPMVAVPADKTAQVFRALAAKPITDDTVAARSDLARRVATHEGLIAAMREVGNDLLAPACRVMPVVGEVLAALAALPGVVHVQLAGGGPTCLAVVGSRAAAELAASQLAAEQRAWWVRMARINGV